MTGADRQPDSDSSEVIAREATPADLPPTVPLSAPTAKAAGSEAGGAAKRGGDTVVKGSPYKALGVLALLIGAAGGVGAAIQYAQFLGGEVVSAEVLRIDEREVGEDKSFRYLVRVDRAAGESAEGYLDSREQLAAAQRVTVTYHPGARRELVLGDGGFQRLLLQLFGGIFGLGIALLIFDRVRSRRGSAS